MRTYKFIGVFISQDGHKYELEVNCNGYLQAFFLLTADAIRSARHYQLATITDENNQTFRVGDISQLGNQLFSLVM